jgi:hypothetical protein
MVKVFTSTKYQLILIFTIAMLIRLLCFAIGVNNYANFQTPDSAEYLTLADNLIATNFYDHGAGAEIFRVPGYPLFLALLKLCSLNIFSIIVIQTVISASTCLLVWHLTQAIFKDKYIALTAALIQACSVVAIVFSLKILSETLFTFMLILGLLLIEILANSAKQTATRKNLWLAVFAGCALAACCLCRAIILPLIPLFCGYIWWRCRKWQPALWFAIPIMLIFLGWSARNYFVADFPGYSTVSSINLYRYNGCALLAKQNNRTFTVQQQQCDKELDKYASQSAKAEFAKKQGLKVILNAPFSYAIIHLKADLNNLLPASGELFNIAGAEVGGNGTLAIINSAGIISGVKHYFKGKWWLIFIAIPMIIFLGLIYLFSLIGALKVTTTQPEQRFIILLYIIIIAWFILIPGPASHPRFRVPISPLLAILAATGTLTCYRLYYSRHKSK